MTKDNNTKIIILDNENITDSHIMQYNTLTWSK